MIHGRRVRQARELRGLTQVGLARLIDVQQPTIAQIESGRLQPARATIEAIALQTKFPVLFFEREPYLDFPEGTLRFRARKAMTAREEAEAYWWGLTLFEVALALAERVNHPSPRLPRLVGSDPELAARQTRAAIGLPPDTPIPNLMLAIEKAGVLVLVAPVPMARRDAYSLWAGENGDIPVIVICNGSTGDRLRHSVAHEVGHLVMHQQVIAPLDEVEKEAHRFAGALLMPGEAFSREVDASVTLSALAPLKPRWGLSIQALVRRALDLGLITRRQYFHLFETIGRKGWRTREPENLDIPVERPRMLRKMAEVLYGIPVDTRRLASDLRLTKQTVDEIMSSHGRQADLDAGPQVSASRVVAFGGRGKLPSSS